MAKRIVGSNRIDADYTEDVVGFALEAFLTVLTFPHRHFSIEPFSRSKERWLGADARLHSGIRGFRPFYMQFKRPSAYPDMSHAHIIKDRKKLTLPVVPRSLYFALREKQKTHREFQHNILYRLREKLQGRGVGDAAYVCPLFLDRSAYRDRLHLSGLARHLRHWPFDPWDLEDIRLNHSRGTIAFNCVPVLAEHITIPPHAKVTSAKHSYSFSEQGGDLCFHSPEALPEGAATLDTFLAKLLNGFLEGGEKIQFAQANQELRNLIAHVDDSQLQLLPDDAVSGDPIGNWMAWGDYLRKEHGIEQFALVRWDD
ncbi:hypothetical protein [Rhizobium rhizogenes]|uniref:hypothetical protein n=1 Tax=Rhizobium rhizogenes TaxID=359 RepID=UPI00080FC108|nr:hypothetical protein [Rhizobium rhizogenes]NTI46121.1 hypothetical protein [Rhizobium rhizogenes]OCJ22160.1 hypothetical protein A6U88_30285 [Agrobacterium sp. B131/95]